MQNATLAGDYETALAVQDKLMPLHNALFVESSPGPVKYAASLIGKAQEDLRLPLMPISDSTRTLVQEALAHAGIV